jgi:hypothetical protein
VQTINEEIWIKLQGFLINEIIGNYITKLWSEIYDDKSRIINPLL